MFGLLLGLVISPSSYSQRAGASLGGFGFCSPALVLPQKPEMEIDNPVAEATDIEADSMITNNQGTPQEETILRGEVYVARDDRLMVADEVRYRPLGGEVSADGNVQLWQGDTFVGAKSGVLNTEKETTKLEHASFIQLQNHAHGNASSVTISGQELINANDATYSTCVPGEEDWILRASSIHIDQIENRGEATDVVIDFKGVPIFYSPWLSFPISNQRKSGLLAPSFRLSGSSGAEVTVPYYFNIAPHLDATVAARGMTERGLQVQGEFRYLLDWGTGTIQTEVLPLDQNYDNQTRVGLSYVHTGHFTPRWYSDVLVDWVSDKRYFEDLGTNLNLSSQTYLSQRAGVYYSGVNFDFLGQVQNYLIVDRNITGQSGPYRQLPRLRAQTKFRERIWRPHFEMAAEVVNFTRENSTTGLRVDIDPSVSFPIRRAGYFLIPKAKLRYTQYALDGNGLSDSSPNRLLPVLSFDSGLFFDRQIQFSKARYTQTLEPRVYYLYVPFRNQEQLPVFDSGEYTFGFAQLFRDNRFGGADRHSDANQLTLALTSRLLQDRTGNELLRASLGQIYYFRNRRVQLPGNESATKSESNLVAEFTANIQQRWRLGLGVQWDPDAGEAERGTIGVRYAPDRRRVVNASYRYVRNTVDQADFSAAWPLSPKWRAVGRFNYSLQGNKILETFGGIEYQSCCWGFRTIARRYLSNIDGGYTDALFFQFELKGLAGLGSASELLDRSIPGYQAEF